jgi:hypothetical protein
MKRKARLPAIRAAEKSMRRLLETSQAPQRRRICEGLHLAAGTEGERGGLHQGHKKTEHTF